MTSIFPGPAAQAAALAALCLLLTFSQPARPASAQVPAESFRDLAAARWIEPRLSGLSLWQPCRKSLVKGRLIAEADCPPPHTVPHPVSNSDEDCEKVTATHQGALLALALLPRCTEAAVDSLRSATVAAPQKGALWSDLAAAYYVRAQRTDTPSDLLRSLAAAQRGVEAAPLSAAARFNLALAQEELGFSTEALASWDQLRRADSPWGREAGQHWARLDRKKAAQAATTWPLNRERLPMAVRAGDRAAVRQLIAPYAAATQRYLEEELLPAWAQARADHDPEAAQRHLALAEPIAAELAQLTGDRYPRETVAVIVAAVRRPGQRARLDDLQQGLLAFQQARREERALCPKAAAASYRQASRSLARAGCPLRLGADLGLAIALLLLREEQDSARDLLARLEQETCKQGHGQRYDQLCGRIQGNHAYDLFYRGRYLESQELYETALGRFERMHDREDEANARIRRCGVLRVLGQDELAWREAFQAHRHLPGMVVPQSRNYLLGETATTASELGFPAIAVAYESAAVGLILDQLASTPSSQAAAIEGLQDNLAIARRARAAFEVRLGQYALAQQDLAEASRLAKEPRCQEVRRQGDPRRDESVRQAILARIAQVEGESLTRSDPRRAIALLTEAIQRSGSAEYHSFRATLLIDRAEAYRQARQPQEAKRDLEAALAEVRAEEKDLLERRQPGQGEPFWSGYFNRFQDVYRILIRQLVDEGDQVKAFAYAEKARAFEPLNLVLRLRAVPEAFVRFAHDGEPLPLEQIQASLPRGTFLLEYCVLADRTFAWLVSRDHFEPFTLAVGRDQIQAWTTSLHRAAGQRLASSFEAGLSVPFPALLAQPWSRIEQLSRGMGEEERRLVLVPDGPIHGLPFAALRLPAARSPRYLVEALPVSVAASATLYAFSLARDAALPSNPRPRVLLVGDPAYDPRSELTRGLPPLAHAREEIQEIRKVYAHRPGGPCAAEVKALTGRDATVHGLLSQARNSTVVYLASHAVANPMAPHDSMLLLAPSRGQSEALNAEEMLGQLELEKTRLCVLAACSTSGGHPVGPEGLAALVRPFIAAGVPGIVGTLWDVESQPAASLMPAFHRYFWAGHDAAAALRLAQLDLLKAQKPGRSSPLAWAPFQVVGRASSPCPPLSSNARRVSP
jgi:hypothetical protein